MPSDGNRIQVLLATGAAGISRSHPSTRCNHFKALPYFLKAE